MNTLIIAFVGFVIIALFGFIYYQHSKKRQLVKMFPRFFQEIYNNTSSGMSLVEAVRKSKYAKYRGLTPFIKNMCLQIEWGTPFTVALRNFGKRMNDKFINKIIDLTEKSSEFSPDIGKSMKEINDYISLTEKLERERNTELFPQLVSLYIVFFIFLGIILVIFKLFVPSLGAVNADEYVVLFQHLIIIEAFFSGLVIGKIVEDSYFAGIKHLVVLLFVSIIFCLFAF